MNTKTYTKTVTYNVGDVVECLTEDGWEVGTIVELKDDTVVAFMGYLNHEVEFFIDNVR